ncbi:hypothetical protein ABZP36_005472 [Zizania latifolia]
MAASDVEYRCFVGGLAWATDDRSLEAAFSSYGEIVDSKIINDRETGRSRGFGFVTFSSEQSMRDAIEGMNGKELDVDQIDIDAKALGILVLTEISSSVFLVMLSSIANYCVHRDRTSAQVETRVANCAHRDWASAK